MQSSFVVIIRLQLANASRELIEIQKKKISLHKGFDPFIKAVELLSE